MKQVFDGFVVLAPYLIACSVGCGSGMPAAGTEENWGLDSRGLRLKLSPVISAGSPLGGPRFELAFQNISSAELVLKLGYLLANGRQRFPAAIQLIDIDPSGRTQVLEIGAPAVAGRVEEFIVYLPAGSSHTLSLRLDRYSPPVTPRTTVRPIPGQHHIKARFLGEVPRRTNVDPTVEPHHQNWWTGRLDSNVVEFTVGTVPPW